MASARARRSRREIVGDQGIGGRDPAGFADADAEPAQEQLPIAGRTAAQRGEAAPHRERAGDHRAAAGAVGEIRQRHTERGIEQREGKPADGAELGVGQVQVGLDRRGEDAEDLAVEEIEDVGEKRRARTVRQALAPCSAARLAQKFTPRDRNTCRGGP